MNDTLHLKKLKKSLVTHIRNGHLPKRILESHPEFINKIFHKQFTLLHLAIRYDHWDVVEGLLSLGASKFIEDNKGYTCDELIDKELKRKQTVFKIDHHLNVN